MPSEEKPSEDKPNQGWTGFLGPQAQGHVTRACALSDSAQAWAGLGGNQLPGAEVFEGGWCVGCPKLGSWGRSFPRGSGVLSGCVFAGLCPGGGSPCSGLAAAAAASESGEQVTLEEWMMTILVVLSNNFAVTWSPKRQKTLYSYPQTQNSVIDCPKIGALDHQNVSFRNFLILMLAAETFDGGNGETQTTSPAIPWAAFPTVSGVHLSPASPEIVLDHDHSPPSLGCLSSDAIISSPENVHADNTIMNQTIPKAQIQQTTHTHLDIPLFPLGLTDEASNGTVATVDESEDSGTHVSNIQLQQKISSLEIKLKASEEEKLRIKKDVESLMEKHSVLEKGFLKEKEQEASSFQDRYKELQVSLVD
ncbi:Hypothetical predicted protein [Marmota monax]|uniref:Uncharacterized protein n=1 Tax=Marmota monax TaxID=9995 RepID=A0A5E4BGN2_MARMO|nr:hypothetical protein GHT09_015541 [Marmota monax]VTJ68426.1 Hypothetical predicted protein [Marmota monax]